MTPALRPEALEHLRQDVGTCAATEFAQCFLALLYTRVEGLRRAVAAGDANAAHVCVLSLHSSAIMVGAAALAEHAAWLLAALRTGLPAREVVYRISELTDQARTALLPEARPHGSDGHTVR
ncbi:hypothetical protein PU560_10150 [Georgenia sp. 10Sc9-8]|uniref:Hpt domain-containing protein n=1 Tax=Georgenia halotolerans TaxID=3028317 RepID=A0ABT5TXN1_9MICO|nr:hypothetical protein [Georgenia halotolerans]